MADNLSVKDGAGATRTIAAKDVSSVHVTRHNLVNESNVFVDVGGKLDTLAGYLDGVEGYTNGTQIEAAAINTVLGVKADAKSTATDTTSISAMSVWKQISASVQAIATSVASLVTGTVLAAGTALIGRVVADASAATGGIASCARLASSGASTNATNAKASAGRLYSAQARNVATYDVYLVLYDTSGTPTPGTTTIRKKVCIPALSAVALDWPVGLTFGSGLAYAITKLAADADTTAVAAGDVLQLNLDYV